MKSKYYVLTAQFDENEFFVGEEIFSTDSKAELIEFWNSYTSGMAAYKSMDEGNDLLIAVKFNQIEHLSV